MALITLQNISIAFGGPKLLDGLSLQIEKNQSVCLLGRNGAGKSTLMKIIDGQIKPDSGTVQKDANVKISYFAQKIPQDLSETVFEIVAKGLGRRGELFLKYHLEEIRLSDYPDASHDALNKLHEDMENYQAWSALEEIKKILSRMSLNQDWVYNVLSGGQKRRVLLAAALVSQPDLLLLDEPTNHLDIQTIAWLEEFLKRLNVTLLFVTHDRMLLRRLASRIVEIDRGRLIDWSCDYDTFLQRKQAVLENEEKEWDKFDKKLVQEEIWIRQGIKARRTRDEGRVRALKKMREERRTRREKEGSASIKLSDAQLSGKMVLEAKDVVYRFGDEPLIQNFSIRIMRGDKIGIIGPNGCGKTTLVNLLLGRLAPQNGTIRTGANLSVIYYDQLREQLDENKTVWQNVLPNGDFVELNGKQKHIISYLQDFLFTPERAKTPIRHLSGGERNRLLLAKLFTRPANLMVLDEPTNDLDAETLELLEELLINFAGTVLLICHDRTFLNNVVTSTLAFSKNGLIKEYVGGYDDWIKQSAGKESSPNEVSKVNKKALYKEKRKSKQKTKLSFKEAQELKALPVQIESWEAEQQVIYDKMADPDFFRNKEDVVSAKARLAKLEAFLSVAFERWEYLESVEE